MQNLVYSLMLFMSLTSCQSIMIRDKSTGLVPVSVSSSETSLTTPSFSPETFVVVEPADIKWQDVPGGLGTQFAILKGNPAESGTYVIRVRFSPFVMDREHFHTGDRYVTVIEGEWFAGTGTKFDPPTARRVVAGGYMFHPANAVHWDGSASASGAVVQIIGMGPITTKQLHTSQSDWVDIRN